MRRHMLGIQPPGCLVWYGAVWKTSERTIHVFGRWPHKLKCSWSQIFQEWALHQVPEMWGVYSSDSQRAELNLALRAFKVAATFWVRSAHCRASMSNWGACRRGTTVSIQTSSGVPGWLSRLNVWLLVSAQVMIPRSWHQAQCRAPRWARSLVKTLSLSLSLSPSAPSPTPTL